MKLIRLLCFVLLIVGCCTEVSARRRKTKVPVPEAPASNYTLIVSLDGFRWDYRLMYQTPFLDSLGIAGVQGQMRPSFPSKTFPNHYTLATGLVPDHHGIIANTFLDRASGRKFSLSDPETKFDRYFYHGEPIWVTAQRAGHKCGVIYWPGSDTGFEGFSPTYYHKFVAGQLLSFEDRITEAKRLFSLPVNERPRLVMLYFEEPDHDGHWSGPAHPVTRATVHRMDSLMHSVFEMVQSLPQRDSVNLIITADHGMTLTSPQRLIRLSEHLDSAWVQSCDYSIPTMLDVSKPVYVDSVLEALAQVPHLRAWRRSDVPAYLQFGSNPNVGDVVINPDLGWVIGEEYRLAPGQHGFDPYEGDMQVLFCALGPDFKQGYIKQPLFQNTAIYPLLCKLLGIEPATNDGDLMTVIDFLK